MIPDILLDQTVTRFPRFIRDSIQITPVEKGGSDRKYYRIAVRGEASLILVKYGNQREENRHYCDVAAFLAGLQVRVPTIYYHDADEGLIWMEDLGEADLWQFRTSPWPVRRALYRNAMKQVIRLHTAGCCNGEVAATPLPKFQNAFDAALYRWEQNYFFENCVGRYFNLTPEAIETKIQRNRLNGIADQLAALPRVLIHRDFQSQNIMVLNERAYLIDFQGMRPGLSQYDLASLLYDPYVTFTPTEREALFADYITLCAEAGYAVSSNFREIFELCAMQRLMQALGAYGFLGLVKGRTQFLQHIPAALVSLREVTARIPGLDNLRSLVDGLTAQSL